VNEASRQVERDVLGAALLAGARTVDALAADHGLRTEHFEFESHRELWAAMLRLRDEDRPVDPSVVAASLNGNADPSLIARCMDGPLIPHAAEYAAEVMRFHTLRLRRRAGQLLIQAGDGDDSALEQAEALLNAPTAEHAGDVRDPEQLGRDFIASISDPEPMIPLPFPGLNRLMNGGMARGDVTLIGAPTNYGKSFLIDTELHHAVSKGFRCMLFDNEMQPTDRVARTVARMTGIPFGKLRRGSLSLEERAQAEDAAGKLPFGITDCTGWTVDEVCRVVRRAEFDLYGLDILHNFPLRKREEWEDAALALKRAAHLARRHLLVAVHVRKRGTGDAASAVPTLDDVAEAGGITKRPANVIFVHRKLSDNGKPENTSWLYVKKNRHGPLGKVEANFDGERSRFLESAEP
jgi:replicative DNA helicase